jgi:hypothetical protein
VKWSMERFYRWHRNLFLGPNPTISNLICQTTISEIADYTSQTSICQTFIAQNPYKFLAIFVGFCEKKYIKVWIILENQEKRFDNIMVCYW